MKDYAEKDTDYIRIRGARYKRPDKMKRAEGCLRRCLALLALSMLLAIPCAALDDDEYDGYAADSLTVKVGYFGGPYYEKYVFSLDELWSMDVVYADYTFIDNMPSVVIDHVAGVRLADIMDAAGIDLNSIETFYFWTRDKQSDYYTSYSKTSLIDTPRYCYYSLPDNYDDEEGGANEYAASYGEPVDTVIALADDWNRCIAGATFGSDYLGLNTNTRFRLIFGQTDVVTQTASRSAKWIHEIVVELGGAPTLTLDAAVLEGEVGSVLRTEASVAADSAVLANETVTWSSSDESIAAVDGNGNITVYAEGTAVVTASFAGVTASVTVNGTPGEESGAAAGSEGEEGENSAQSGETAEPERIPESIPENIPERQEEDEVKANSESAAAPVLLQPVTVTGNTAGGVQNWRREEMSETATALPDIQADTPLLRAIGIIAAALFLGSIAAYAAIFYINIGRKKNERRF